MDSAAQPPRSLAPSFDETVAVHPSGPGRWMAAVHPAWNGPVAPNGGVLAAIMTRAAQAELGPGGAPPRTIAAHYLSVPKPGEVELRVEVLRTGRRVSFLDVRMLQRDRLTAQATVVCSAAREVDSNIVTRPPAAPRPRELPLLDSSTIAGGPPMFTRLEMRSAFGPPIFSGSAEAVAGGWLAFGDDDAPLDAARLCAMSDAWWPAMFAAHTGMVGIPTLQLTVYLRSVEPAVAGPALARFESRNALEGHVEETGELWSVDGRLLAESRQLSLLLPFITSG